MATLTLQQLSQKFYELTAQYQTGQINQASYYSIVYQLQAQDDDGTWWRADPVRQTFLRYDGQQWVPASLPGSQNKPIVSRTENASADLILRYRSGSGEIRSIPLTSDVLIGRSRECDVILDDGKVSRRHAKITVLSDGCFLNDLNSSNGTKLDQRLLTPNTPHKLSSGQEITIGSSQLSVLGGEEDIREQEKVIDSPFLQSPPVQPGLSGAGGVQSKQSYPEQIQPNVIPGRQEVGSPAKKRKSKIIPLLMIGGAFMLCLCVALAGGVILYSNMQPREATEVVAEIPVREKTYTLVEDTAIEVEKTRQPVPAIVNTETVTPALEEESDTWLVMLYTDADDMNIEGPLYLNVNEAELVGSNQNVQVVTQLDMYSGNFEAPQGDWTTTKRFLLHETEYWDYITSDEIADLGEQNMGDAETLVDFVIWAVNTYPADRYALIMTDHGDGWMGGFYDEDPSPDMVGQLEVHIELVELEQALSYITQQTGIGKFDLIGLDACLMSMLEVYTAIAPYGEYAVASEEVEPFLGWAYESILRDLQNEPTMDGAGLAHSIVRSYIEEDFIVNYDDIRQEVFGYGVSREEVLWQYYPTITLSAVDLSKIPDVNLALNEYIEILKTVDQSSIAWARTNAQHYQDIFMEEDSPLHASSNIDLGNFVSLAADETGNPDLQAASARVNQAIYQAVIYEKHGDERNYSQGISIYFPVSELYQMTYEQLSYTMIARKFSEESTWDDYLYFHYSQ